MILRELLLKLHLNVDEASFAKGAAAGELVAKGIEKLADMAVEAVKGFIELVDKTAEASKEITETAQATGLTTKALQELRDVAGEAGIDTAALDTSLFRLSRSMFAAKKGGDDQAKVFSHLGVKTTDAAGKLRSTDDVLMDLSDHFAKMPDGAEKTALAMEIFGRQGARLIPILNKGKEGLAELRAEQTVMTDEQLEAGKELKESQYALGLVTRNLWRTAIGPLLPVINSVIKRFLEWRKANADILKVKIQQYIGYAIKAIELLAGAMETSLKVAGVFQDGLKNIATWVWNLANAVPALKVALILIGAALALAFAPLTAVAAMLTGLMLVFDDLDVYSKGGKSVFGRFKKELDDWLKPNEQDPWWLIAVKDLVRLLERALLLKHEFDQAMGRVDPREVDRRAGANEKAMQADIDRRTIATARQRAGKGLPLTDVEKQALQRSGNVTEEVFNAKYAPGGLPSSIASPAEWSAPYASPEYRAPGGGGAGINAPVSIGPVIQQPGEDSEAFAQRVGSIVENHWDGKMEEAASGVSQ